VADALLVFSPLQEICFFVLRSPYLDQIGVAPLLRRRLIGLQRFFSLLVLQVRLLTLSSALCVLLFLPYGNLYNSLALPLCSHLSMEAPILAKLLTQRRSVPTF
jgi:hypothetical protein